MNGPHDMGGMQCYGRVVPEPDEPIFHDDWEKRALALTVGMGFCGKWNIDVSRFARESLPPEFYLSSSYYQIWIAGLQNLMIERGMVTREELGKGSLEKASVDVNRVVSADAMPAALAKGGPVDREPTDDPIFAVGQAVRTFKGNPKGHTRLPRYARDAQGVVSSIQGFHVFPDSNARGEGENPQWVYNVAFDAKELFGQSAEEGNQIMIDCWESYLAAE